MSEPLEKEVQLHERNAQGQDVLIYPLPPGGYPLAVTKGGTGADSAAEACEGLGAVKKSGDTMTGNLSITGYLYPSVYLMPTYNGVACRGVIEGSYVGAASFSVFEDASGSNRRMIEVRSASYAPSMDNAALLRTAVNGTYYAHRIFHTGMETPVPVGNGGTGASDAAIFFSLASISAERARLPAVIFVYTPPGTLKKSTFVREVPAPIGIV
jgi:hypothetical protein